MAELAVGGCSKLNSSFLHTQNGLSSSDSLFAGFSLLNFGKHDQYTHKQQNNLCIHHKQHNKDSIKASASTLSSPPPSSTNVGYRSGPSEEGMDSRAERCEEGMGYRSGPRGDGIGSRSGPWGGGMGYSSGPRGDGRGSRSGHRWEGTGFRSGPRREGMGSRSGPSGERMDYRSGPRGEGMEGRPFPSSRPSPGSPPAGSRLFPGSRPTKPPGRRLLRKEGMPPPRRQTLLGVRDAILKPPLDDSRLADKFLRSPQLALKTLPLLSSCLPYSPLHAQDEEWMEEFMPEIKEALGYPLPGMDAPTSPDSPIYHLNTLLYIAFQHSESPRGTLKYLRVAHSRLAFLGQYILELALTEYFLVRYPRETPACMRERIFGLTNKKVLPYWLRSASLDRCVYPDGFDTSTLGRRLPNVRGVFWALIASAYLCMGMGEVYRLLFEVFGLDPDAEHCQPKRRLSRPDVDFVYEPFDGKPMEWSDYTSFKSADDAVFAKPLLYRACVPPGMQRFRGNLWEIDSLPQVLQILGYPLQTVGEDLETVMKRNTELELGLQVCFLHPSNYKAEHPRFCNERFEYLGSKIQDVVMAEKLLMKHLDAPAFYIQEKHRKLLFNRVCGKYFREKKLQKLMIISEPRKVLFEKARRLKNFATTGCSLALHGLGYTVYGKAEVRRIMFEFLDFERLQVPH